MWIPPDCRFEAAGAVDFRPPAIALAGYPMLRYIQPGAQINNSREARVKFLRFWSDLSMWNKFGLSMVAAVLLLILLIFIF